MIVPVMHNGKVLMCDGQTINNILKFLSSIYHINIKTINLLDMKSGEIAQNPLNGNPLKTINIYLKSCITCNEFTFTNKKWCKNCRCNYACNILMNSKKKKYYKFPKSLDSFELDRLMVIIDDKCGI